VPYAMNSNWGHIEVARATSNSGFSPGVVWTARFDAALAPEAEILGRAIGELLAQRLAATPYVDEEE